MFRDMAMVVLCPDLTQNVVNFILYMCYKDVCGIVCNLYSFSIH